MAKTKKPDINPQALIDPWRRYTMPNGHVMVTGKLWEIGNAGHMKAASFYPVVLAKDAKSFRYEDRTILLGKEELA